MIRNPPLISGIFESCTVELQALSERHDLSSYLDVNQLVTKSMLMSCASFYEDEVTRIVRNVLDAGNHTGSVRKWLNETAVDGQFYKWFNFRGATNTNGFLAKFGKEFKDNTRRLLESKDKRKQAEQAFLDLCQKRNECVHRNYAAYSLDLTIQEIYDKHKLAMSYIRVIDCAARNWLIVVAQPPLRGRFSRRVVRRPRDRRPRAGDIGA
jgi:hypothetical protein